MRAPSSLTSSAAFPRVASASSTSSAVWGEHRLNGAQELDLKTLEPRFAVGESGKGDLSKIARDHERPAHGRRGKPRRFCHPFDHDAFERAVPQLAAEQPADEILFVRDPFLEKIAQKIGAPLRRARTGDGFEIVKNAVELQELESRRVSRLDTAERRVANTDTPLTDTAREIADHERHFAPLRATQKISEMPRFFEPASRCGDGVRHRHEIRKFHRRDASTEVPHSKNVNLDAASTVVQYGG